MIEKCLNRLYSNKNGIKIELIWDVESKNIL